MLFNVCDMYKLRHYSTLPGQYMCYRHPGDELQFHLLAYDRQNVSKRMHAVNDTIDIIPSCVVTGSGSLADPYSVLSRINILTDDVIDNDCGLTVVRISILTFPRQSTCVRSSTKG